MPKPANESFTHQDGRAEAHGWSRRKAIQTILGAAGAGLVLPGLGAAQVVPGASPNVAAAQAGSEAQTAAAWEPIFLDAHQNETLVVLCERLIPNSAAAQANRFIDTLLSVQPQESQREFVAALSAFEHEAITRHNQPFKDLTEDQQIAIVTAASEQKPSRPVEMGRRRHGSFAAAAAENEEAPPNLRDHFEILKRSVAESYFSSEAGMKELGWTGQVVWPGLPGCDHPE